MALKEARGHRHSQTTAATIWTITHNLDTIAPIVDVFVTGTNQKIMPLSVVATDSKTVTVTFSANQTGIAFVA